ncbi:MAG: ImmA/IrrE family metallo-endopeptidase [Limnochordia bacterium]
MIIPYPIDDLIRFAYDAGIDDVIDYPDPRCPRARYICCSGVHLICVNPTLLNDTMSRRCALAHEISHFIVGVGGEHIDGESRDEERARRYARRLLMPDKWILDRLTLPVWEISEQAGVYQNWAAARIRDMERVLSYV